MDNNTKTIAKTADLALRSQQAFYAEVVNACQIDVARASVELKEATEELGRLRVEVEELRSKISEIEVAVRPDDSSGNPSSPASIIQDVARALRA